MTFREYLLVLRKRWRVTFLFIVLGLGVAGGATAALPVYYSAEATTFVSITGAEPGQSGSIYQSSQFAFQRAKSYTTVVNSPQVLEPVISELGLSMTVTQLSAVVTAENPADTVLIRVSATSTDPTRAQQIANATARHFGLVVERLETPRASGQSPVKVTTAVPATVPSSPSSPDPVLNLLLGLLTGIALGVIAAVLRDQQDTSVKLEDLQDATGRAPLGLVSHNPNSKQPLVAMEKHGRFVEQFRTVRTNLKFVDVDKPPCQIVVTSAMPGEGKSVTACNLAISLAQTPQRVCLVEADLRLPTAATLLGLDDSLGLSNVLAGQVTLDEVMVPWQDGLLMVLPAGTRPPDPTSLLGSRNMRAVLARLRNEFDYVIIDTPPLLVVTDAALLAHASDGAIVVARHGKTRREQLGSALDALDSVGADLIGTILTSVPANRSLNAYEVAYKEMPGDDASSGALAPPALPTAQVERRGQIWALDTDTVESGASRR